MFDYTFELLGERLKICVTPDHKFGTDAFLLSDFAAPRRRDIACDLGTGCGIIPVLWFRSEETAPKIAYAVELQQKAADQLAITLREGGIPEGRLVSVHADLRELRGRLPAGSADVVTCNPPYKTAGTGIMSETDADRIARHETMCSIEDVCAAARYLLKFGGKLCICQRPERLADVIAAMRHEKLEPKRLRFVQQRPDTPPWLFLLEGRRGGKPFLQVDAPLIIEGEGGFSPELLRIYQKEHNL
ncbi:MAG: methyltransferase [Ruminococcaceae bacterium]|nr:methyltransferase [Oscillospiraceae bacterium]